MTELEESEPFLVDSLSKLRSKLKLLELNKRQLKAEEKGAKII